MIDEIENVGFTKTDRIDLSLNDDKKSIFRIKATIEHLLKSAEVEGHSYLTESELLERLQQLLEVKIEADRFEKAISELKKEAIKKALNNSISIITGGPGTVLKDMISSGIISTTELKENFRQSDEVIEYQETCLSSLQMVIEMFMKS